MTDRDDSLEQSSHHFADPQQDGQQQDAPSAGSTPIPRPDDTESAEQPADFGGNDSDATTVVPRTDLPAATDDGGSAGSLYAGNRGQAGSSRRDDDAADSSAQPDRSGQPDSSGRDGGEATSSGRPNSSGEPASNPPTSDYPATQHFHTPADQDSTRAISQQQYSAPKQYSGQRYSPPQPTAQQAYGAVTDSYPAARDSNDQAGQAGGQRGYPDTSGAAAPGHASTQSGFFSPQGGQQPVRVEVTPASLRFGHNLAGGLLGIVLAAGAAALYVLVTKNHLATQAPGTGFKLALIGLAILLAIPGLVAGWAPAAAWLPGLILAVVGSAAVLSSWVNDKIVSLSNTLFNSPALDQFAVSWALVGGWVLLLAGIGAQMARRSATTAAMDRIVHD